jgi:hypothetical protein
MTFGAEKSPQKNAKMTKISVEEGTPKLVRMVCRGVMGKAGRPLEGRPANLTENLWYSS